MQKVCIIDGKKIALLLLEQLQSKVALLSDGYGIEPGLAVILVGSDPASLLYVKNKTATAQKLGVRSVVHQLPSSAAEDEILCCVRSLNSDFSINGILVQLPLPAHINTQNIIDAIDHRKDVDGFSTHNVGLLNTWQDSLEPCTPQGVLLLLRSVYSSLSAKKVVILGRSRIVGRPMASLLIKEGCSVTSLNSHSMNLPEECKKAEIIISAVGAPLMVKREWVMPGACVVDVGIVRVGNKLCGDVDFENVKDIVSYITPVPGGVGPMTVACLMQNTLKAAYNQYGIAWS